jgi:hypothetical protein
MLNVAVTCKCIMLNFFLPIAIILNFLLMNVVMLITVASQVSLNVVLHNLDVSCCVLLNLLFFAGRSSGHLSKGIISLISRFVCR